MSASRQQCEMDRCRKKAVGRFQVYDDNISKKGPVATINRPAWMCASCVAFAKQCGMRPVRE